jgi:hypothetical protein
MAIAITIALTETFNHPHAHLEVRKSFLARMLPPTYRGILPVKQAALDSLTTESSQVDSSQFKDSKAHKTLIGHRNAASTTQPLSTTIRTNLTLPLHIHLETTDTHIIRPPIPSRGPYQRYLLPIHSPTLGHMLCRHLVVEITAEHGFEQVSRRMLWEKTRVGKEP